MVSYDFLSFREISYEFIGFLMISKDFSIFLRGFPRVRSFARSFAPLARSAPLRLVRLSLSLFFFLNVVGGRGGL